MKKQIITGVILLVIGVMLGFFVVVNWQLSQAITKTEVALATDSQRLDVIEKYLTDSFAPKQETNTNK
jgi:predicted negative regulator of RcsB-dependent stress response